MGREKEMLEHQDWRENFEREIIARSSLSDEVIERLLIEKYRAPDTELARHAALNYKSLDEVKKEIELSNQQHIAEGRDRDLHMLTSRDIFDLLNLHAKKGEQPALEQYYSDSLMRACEKLRWAIEKELERQKHPHWVRTSSQNRLIRGLEDFLHRLGKVMHPTASDRDRILVFDEIIHALHHAPDTYLAPYIIRDFRHVAGIREVSKEQQREFFDKLSEY